MSAISRVSSVLRAMYTLRSEEHTSELQSQSNLVCRLLLEKKKSPARLSTRQRLRSARSSDSVPTDRLPSTITTRPYTIYNYMRHSSPCTRRCPRVERGVRSVDV